jgi:TPR repeat protein
MYHETLSTKSNTAEALFGEGLDALAERCAEGSYDASSEILCLDSEMVINAIGIKRSLGVFQRAIAVLKAARPVREVDRESWHNAQYNLGNGMMALADLRLKMGGDMAPKQALDDYAEAEMLFESIGENDMANTCCQGIFCATVASRSDNVIPAIATSALERAIARGDSAAKAIAGRLLTQTGDYDMVIRGRELLAESAEDKNALALDIVGECHLTGDLGFDVDPRRGEELLKEAIALGSGQAAITLAKAYWHGSGVSCDRDAAREFLGEAARLGCAVEADGEREKWED